MKFVKYSLLILALISVSAQAETIDVNGGLGGYVIPTNSAAKFCVKLTLIKRLAGTFITGLTTAKIKPVRVVELSTTGVGQVSKNFNVTYTLAASTAPVQAGVYDFCLTPAVGTVWKKTTSPIPTTYSYYVDAVVLGTVAADNGAFSLFLN